MKVLWTPICEFREYDKHSWNYTKLEARFLFLGKEYLAVLRMATEECSWELKPYFQLSDENWIICETSEEMDHYGPMSDHSDEITESLWDDCIDWVSSHK